MCLAQSPGQQMRDAILSGEKEVSDEDLVRCTNAAMRAMKVLEQRKTQQGNHVEPTQEELIEELYAPYRK
jgi:hypothetical protein